MRPKPPLPSRVIGTTRCVTLLRRSRNGRRGRRRVDCTTTLAEPGSVLVSVEDTGVGLGPAVTQRVLQPFFTTKPEGPGMDCRLSASSRVTHRGAIRFTVPVELAQ
jgi:signal transduction histidine kinase